MESLKTLRKDNDEMTYSKDISAEHHSTFEMNSADLNGKSHYSIKGDTLLQRAVNVTISASRRIIR
jgi:hypothetical protein